MVGQCLKSKRENAAAVKREKQKASQIIPLDTTKQQFVPTMTIPHMSAQQKIMYLTLSALTAI